MEFDTIDAINNGNKASAIDQMKDMLSQKALDVVDAHRQAIAQQMFGDAIGAEPVETTDEIETTPEDEVIEPTLPETSPEVEDTVANAAAAIAGEQPVSTEEPTDETDKGTE